MSATTIQTISELSDFLSSNPSPEQIAAYKASKRSQNRIRHLLMRNQSGLLTEKEQIELNEIEELEHSMTLLKIQAFEDMARRRV